MEYNSFPDVHGYARLAWVRRGLRFTVSLRTGVVLLGGRKTADFLGERILVRVMSGSDTAGILRNRSAAQKFFHR